jgi:hypothetical protein
MAVQVAEEHPVNAQGIVPAEAGGGEQRQDVLQGPQHSRWSLAQRRGQRPSHQQRHHIWVFKGQAPEVVSHGAQLARPVRIRGINAKLSEHGLGDTIEQCGLVRYVPIQHRRIPAHLLAEASHR